MKSSMKFLRLASLAFDLLLLAANLHWVGPALAAQQATLPQGNIVNYKIVAPTPGMTAIANSLSLSVRGLSASVAVRPRLAVPRPVEIVVSFRSDAPTGESVGYVQTYAPNGNIFNWHDQEGRGQPRKVIASITLREQAGNGSTLYFTRSMTSPLTVPIYAVEVRRFRFTLHDSCESFLRGDTSEITLAAVRPDGELIIYNDMKMKKGEVKDLRELYWYEDEVRAPRGRKLPDFTFLDSDQFSGFATPFISRPPQVEPLIPGQSAKRRQVRKKAESGGDCYGTFEYAIQYVVRRYIFDLEGRPALMPRG